MTKYCPEMVKSICEHLAQGKSTKEIENIDGMPSAMTIASWTWQHPEFYEAFDKAREFGTHAMAYNCADSIEKCSSTPEALAKLKIKMDFFKWFIGKLNQRKYGDRTVIAGDKENPLLLSLATTLDARIAARLERKAIDHAATVIDLEPTES